MKGSRIVLSNTDAMEADGIPQQLLDVYSPAGDLGGWPAVIDGWTSDKYWQEIL